ncbi:glycosyltransferase [Maribacter sp. ACAM166]|uniref:glycosyltransferase n=1 Tax=Maribacter sp. ACAM166 TaxID=2508996 RepID=UPI0010FED6D4|nr:glycosyltransferase [Maribacter sp. ACAM166]TLP80760.1 glycosyltransferase [Maribacter sp. ACAM166]
MEMISVCMTTYNGELFIEEQLSSILPQLSHNDEILISDDGSTDKTIDIIKSIEDSRIKLFQNSFKNVILNFEFVLGEVSGDVIFLSDQDDIWYPNKVKDSLKLLLNNDLIFTNLNVFTTEISKGKLMYDPQRNYQGIYRNFLKNHCVGATLVFKSYLLKYVLPIPQKIEMHDMWIFFISSFYGRTNYHKLPLIYYRRHGANVSNTGGKTTNSFLKILQIRLRWILVLLSRIVRIIINKK